MSTGESGSIPRHVAAPGAHGTDRSRGEWAPIEIPGAENAPVLVANDFLFFVVDERTGRLSTTPRVAGLGCTAALLSELVLAGNLVMENGQMLLTQRPPHRDHHAAAELWQEIANNPRHSHTRTWLEFFAPTAVKRVADRMAAARLISVTDHRTLTGKRVQTYLPADVKVGGFPTGRLHRLLTLNDQRADTVVDRTLAALCAATGTIDRFLYDAETARAAQARLTRIVKGLHPYLRDLMAATKAAVGDAVITRR